MHVADTNKVSDDRRLEALVDACGEVILGKSEQIRLAVASLLARGHLLIEDVPGVGKTPLAHVLAAGLGLQYQRVQFTSDMLPADILGVSVYDRDSGGFSFHPGPIFSQLILADEINRATPKTQSALLEAMEEGQVSLEGHTRPLPTPFFVIATQNPTYQIGTFPLPESQLDRFLMRIRLGYPDPAAERALLRAQDRRELIKEVPIRLDPVELLEVQARAARVHVSDALVDYVQELLAFSRRAPYYSAGLSPRAGLALLRAARAWALLDGRGHVLPEDVQAVLGPVVGHRLRPAAELGEASPETLAAHLAEVPIP